MRSIPAAMTWETISRGRWALPAAALGAIGFPALIFLALQSDGVLVPNDSSMLAIHIVMMYCNVLLFASAILTAQGPISKLYAYPAQTSTLVTWRLLPAMTIVFAQTAASIAGVNVLFELGWPVWGPACFIAVAWAAVQAALWLTAKSLLWSIVAITAVAVALGLWFKSRYGAAFGEPMHYWHIMTPAEVATMLAMTVTAYCIGIAAVARNRCGGAPWSLGIVDWLCRYFDSPASPSAGWSSPARAHFRCEWRRKGWLMPFSALVLLTFGLATWLCVSRAAGELFPNLVGGVAMLLPISLVGGILLGNIGSDNKYATMSSYPATRPMTDTAMARVTLGVVALSVFLTWLIWAAAVLIASLALWAIGATEMIHIPRNLTWWIFPGSLLGAWIVAGSLTSLCLTGAEPIFRLAIAAILVFIGLPLFPKFVLSPDAQQLFARAVAAVGAGAAILGTVWIFAAAYRRSLIETPIAWGAAGLWAASTTLIALQWPLNVEPRWLGDLLAGAATALALAPLAAAPLALAANRHR